MIPYFCFVIIPSSHTIAYEVSCRVRTVRRMPFFLRKIQRELRHAKNHTAFPDGSKRIETTVNAQGGPLCAMGKRCGYEKASALSFSYRFGPEASPRNNCAIPSGFLPENRSDVFSNFKNRANFRSLYTTNCYLSFASSIFLCRACLRPVPLEKPLKNRDFVRFLAASPDRRA